MGYNGTIELIAGVKPANNGNFPMVNAKDVYVDDDTRLDAKLNGLDDSIDDLNAAVVTDATLSQTGKPADAKAVGDAINNITIEVDATLSQSGKAADAKATGDAVGDLKTQINRSDAEIYGEIDDTFPLEFENGTYQYTAVGKTLIKYYSGGYDLTRKVVKSTVFNAPCNVVITAKTGYKFSVFTAINGVIKIASGVVDSYSLTAGNQYGMLLRSESGSDDISALTADQIVDIQYKSIVSGIQDTIQGLTYTDDVTLSNAPVVNAFISGDTLKWSTAGSGSSYMIPIQTGAKTITVTTNNSQGTYVCFLKNSEHTIHSSAALCDGTLRNWIPAGETRIYNIPDGCTHVNILRYADSGVDYIPSIVAFNSVVTAEDVFNSGSDERESQYGLTVDEWADSKCVMSTNYTNSGNIQGTVVSASDTLKASGFVPVWGKMLEIPMMIVSDTTYPNYGMSLYDKNKNPIMGRAISAIPNRTGDDYIAWLRIYLPENAKYFRTTYWADSTTAISEGLAPEFSYNLLVEIPDEYKPITHELPVDTYMQNAIRRARQLTDIKWTPRVNIPRYSMMNGTDIHFLDWFYADHEYVGIPYSGAGKGEGSSSGWTAPEEWGYAHKWVGGCVPFDAFVTAARYPNSVFSETVDQSQPDYDSSPFGIVCTGLVNYTVNGPWPLRGIYNFFATSDKVFRRPDSGSTIAQTDKNDIMIGDFLYTRPHVIVITDIMRDAAGNVTHVEMSEATTVGNGNNTILGTKLGGVARRKMWDVNLFKSMYGAYVKYRRTTFYGIPYTPSEYVDTGNEGDRVRIVDLPCIPYLGENAIYRVGYIYNSKICIGASGFTTLVVTKDGETFGEFDVTGLTEVSVGFSEVGSYEAYLSNGTTQTVACHWSVAEGTM